MTDDPSAALGDNDATILPRYDGGSLLNVPASICAVLGGSTDGLAPPLAQHLLPPALLDGVRAVVLLVVDGLGRWQMDAAMARGDAPTLARLAERATRADERVSLATITSVFPSSTMPALATISSGVPPAAHGLIGWTMFLEEYGEAAATARWGPLTGSGSYQDEALGGADPHAFFGVETMHQRLARGGVRSTVVSRSEFHGTGLTEMLFAGADFRGYLATSSVLALVERELAKRADGERLYVYAYWDLIDQLAHLRGPETLEHAEELATLDFALGRWLGRHERRGDVLFLLTADHGHVPTTAELAVRLDQDRELHSLLRSPPTGERRLVYLHARPGQASALRRYCEARLARAAEVIEPDEAFAQGWFGPGPAQQRARRRAGDLLLIARPGVQLMFPITEGTPVRVYGGNHGAMAAREMLVPLVAVRQ